MTSEHPWIAVVDGKRPEGLAGDTLVNFASLPEVPSAFHDAPHRADCTQWRWWSLYRLAATERKINAAPEHGGQKFFATASPEAPAGEHAPVAAPLRTGLRSYRNRWFEPVKRDPLVLMADVYRRMK